MEIFLFNINVLQKDQVLHYFKKDEGGCLEVYNQ